MAQTQLSGYEKLLRSQRNEERADVLICGYYGYGNMGDETLLSVIVRELRQREPSLRICVLSAKPKITRAYHSVDAVSRFDLARIAEKMKCSKMLLFGGGNLLQDKTSTHSLLYYTHILRMAKKYGMKIMVCANGIGPIESKSNQECVKRALALADGISLRDRESFLWAKSFYSEENLRLTFDPAILVESTERIFPYKNYFVVAPKKISPDCEEALIALIDSISVEKQLHPVIISLYDAQDLSYARRIAARTNASFCRLEKAEDCVSLLEHAEFLISSRLHGLIYACVAACPMMGYSDDKKLSSYLEYIGFGAEDAVPCATSVAESTDSLKECARRILSESEYCRMELKKRIPEWKMLARREFAEILK
jgi:polysaccharide pyruvyl transferase CsaB